MLLLALREKGANAKIENSVRMELPLRQNPRSAPFGVVTWLESFRYSLEKVTPLIQNKAEDKVGKYS